MQSPHDTKYGLRFFYKFNASNHRKAKVARFCDSKISDAFDCPREFELCVPGIAIGPIPRPKDVVLRIQ
jgi:hypothetical protein